MGFLSATRRKAATVSRWLGPRRLLRTLAKVDDVNTHSRELAKRVEALRIRTEQLETIVKLDWEWQEDLVRLPEILDRPRIERHVSAAVAAAPLVLDPFPHLVIDKWLPREVYRIMIRALPPPVFFADLHPSRQQLPVPFSLSPTYSRRVWAFIAHEIVDGILSRALNARFDGVVREYIESFLLSSEGLDLSMRASDGRLMLRRPGYAITPHRDPKWGFVTGLIYLARGGDDEAHGTQLYRVREDEEAPSDKPFYIDASRCELVRTVPFRANSMLAFLNSTGAHAASIPADAQPAGLERYVYQFRLGPDTRAIKALLARMPGERRTRWAGAKAEKAVGAI